MQKMLTLLLLIPFSVNSSEFNTDFIQGNAKTREDISKLLNDFGSLPLGTQSYKVYINRQYIGYQALTAIKDKDGKTSLCLSQDHLSKYGIHLTDLAQNALKNKNCQQVIRALNGAIEYDPNSLQLEISIPDIHLMNTDDIRFHERELDKGINAGFVNYSISARYNTRDKSDEFKVPLATEVGLNYHDYRLRANFATSDLGDDSFTRQQAYIAKPIPSILSEVVAGESITQGFLVESIPFSGVSLRSDRDMLPRYKRDYTPVVRGIAESNSTVNIYQGDYLIYTKDVPAGDFAITDLPYLSNNQLVVEVIGENGQVKRFNYTITQIPMLLTEDTDRYEVSVGKYRSVDNKNLNTFVYGEYGHGFEELTLMGAITASSLYYAMSMGSAITLGDFGAVSADYTYSNTEFEHNEFHSGHSFRLLYAKELSESTNLQLAGYRFSSENFRTFSEAVRDNYDREHQGSSILDSATRSRSKSRFDANLNMDLSSSSIYINLAHENYWNKQDSSTSYSVGLNSSWGRMNYSLSASYTDYENSSDDHTVMMTASIPLEFDDKHFSIYSSVIANSNNTTYEVGQSGMYKDYAYSVGASLNKDSPVYARASVSANLDKMNISANVSGNKDGSSTSISASGTMVAFKDDVLFGARRADSYVIAKVGDRKGIEVNGRATNGNGHALVTSIDPYEQNELRLNAKTIPTDIQTQDSIISRVPVRGVIGYVDFKANTVIRFITQLQDGNKNNLPLGTIVALDNKKAVVGVNGRVMLEVNVKDGSQYPKTLVIRSDSCQGQVVIKEPSNQILNLGVTRCY
ncbi:TPA: fimbria/pilus outer membrane usher protein [Photobacterium damselae]